MPSLQKPLRGKQPQFPPKKASNTASTSSLSRQPGWLRCEKQRWRPEREQVFVLLANTLLAPSKMNRVLSSGGRVLSNEELHLEPMATSARMKIQTQQTLLLNRGSSRAMAQPTSSKKKEGSRAKQKRFYSSTRHMNPWANSTPHCHLFRRLAIALMSSEKITEDITRYAGPLTPNHGFEFKARGCGIRVIKGNFF